MKALNLLIIGLFLSACSSTSDKAKSTSEKKAELYYSHGTSKLLSKDYTEALDLLIKANRLKPDDSKILNNLGMAYYFKGEKNLTQTYLKKSIDINPKNSDARNNLASFYFQLGEYEKAKKQYEIVKSDLVYPHQYRTWYNLGLIELRLGNIDKAKEKLIQSLKIKDDYCKGNFTMGLVHKRSFHYSEALKYFKNASKHTCHGIPEPHYQQALMLLELKRYAEAHKKFLEITERFSKTRFAALASVKLNDLGQKENISSETISAENKAKIKTYKSESF